MIAMQRKGDSGDGQWAIAGGGMLDGNERATEAARRELGEEVAVAIDFDNAPTVYQGYVDDPRNTNNAWMETDAFRVHLPEGTAVALDAQQAEAYAAQWHAVDEDFLNNLYASHGDLVRRAVSQWQAENGVVVGRDGHVGARA